MEQLNQPESITSLFNQILDSEPKLITYYVPEKFIVEEQKADFLAGKVRNPNHLYDRLDNVDIEKDASNIETIGWNLLGHADLPPKHRVVYEEFIDGYLKKII